jgi:dihydrofolate synthase/folylpolyglutamate synthase
MPATGTPLSQWLARLETLSPTEINLGLDRVLEVLGRLDLPKPADILIIAGTNGKGSSVAMADALLRASGKRTGAYTSPHIRHYNERIVVNGSAASDADIIASFERIEAARGDAELTYFEFGTLAAFDIFAASNLDVWILEVGMGGRLDATNAVEPSACLITNISLDHCEWLGPDVNTIAVEKAGVMRANKPVVFAASEVPPPILRIAEETGAKLLLAGHDFKVLANSDGSWTWQGPHRELRALKQPGLKGAFQVQNAAAVLALLDAAGLGESLDSELINQVLPTLAIPGRLQEVLVDGKTWLFDVAHNPAAASVLVSELRTRTSDGGLTAIVGVLRDKDVAGVIAPLTQVVDRWVAMTAISHRGLAADDLARQISNLSGKACLVAESAAAAIEFVRHGAAENDRILVTGSFFTVGPVLDQLAANSHVKS